LPNVPLGAHVVIVSTRSSVLDDVLDSQVFRAKPRHRRALDRVVWLDVTSAEVSSVFQLE
jgi:hypothetical protein